MNTIEEIKKAHSEGMWLFMWRFFGHIVGLSVSAAFAVWFMTVFEITEPGTLPRFLVEIGLTATLTGVAIELTQLILRYPSYMARSMGLGDAEIRLFLLLLGVVAVGYVGLIVFEALYFAFPIGFRVTLLSAVVAIAIWLYRRMR